MQSIKRNGVRLAYKEMNSGAPPIILIHGWSCDHTVFARQAEFLSQLHHVVLVDLRGHGGSDAPHQDYTMGAFADDLAWLCTELGLVKPIVVGHSMGGNVALELAASRPELLSSIVLIDTVVFPSQSFRYALQPMVQALGGSDYAAVCRQAMLSTCLPTDDEIRKRMLIASLPKAPQHVLISALKNHLLDYDSTSAAAGCHIPTAYIGASILIADLIQFRRHTPQLVTAQTLGSGHFSPLFVPAQINTMIQTFRDIYTTRLENGEAGLWQGAVLND
jgi:pimeloyl-ACP methyl ester carboxylesterase